MSEATTLMIPEVTDDDIYWVEKLMGLNLDEERVAFLKCLTSMDVAACPGSGKTTLVIAKLAIMAKKWPFRTRGICVLSHTNVAREEIESRLSQIPGNTLLNFPHFIGTIHAFANRFLAIPYLRSKGYADIIVDDVLTHEYRKYSIGWRFDGLNMFLSQKHSSFENLRLKDSSLNFCLSGKDFPAGAHTKSFQHAQMAIKASVKKGFFCYDEMFVWARKVLEIEPSICNWIAARFPLVIIDEVQDTNQEQGQLLRSIFPSSSSVILQRVGDANQAIFSHMNDSEDSALGFPQPEHHTLSKSFRFGQAIAGFAAALAEIPVSPNLIGAGPKKHADSGRNKHTIFVFPQADNSKVLQSFGELVLDTFTDEQLCTSKHRVMAIGGVHKQNEDSVKPEHLPKSVCDYWANYSPERSLRKKNPKSLIGYFNLAKHAACSHTCLSVAAERIAAGILRLARLSGNDICIRANAHRRIVAYLDETQNGKQNLQKYQNLLLKFLLNTTDIQENEWSSLKKELQAIFQSIFPQQVNFIANDQFLAWEETVENKEAIPQGQKKSNIFIVEKNKRRVSINLDSIHGVKGQTHLATLVLETFNRSHFFKQLLPCLIGKKYTGNSKLLKLGYVAMTRPTHLLCLAIPESSLGNGAKFDKNIAALQEMGWLIKRL